MKKQYCLVCGAVQEKLFQIGDFSYHKCVDCGLVSTLPVPSGKVIEGHYAKKFKEGNYQLLRKYASRYVKVYRGIADFILENVGPAFSTGKPKLLDVGSFTGEFMGVMANRGFDVYGVELQKEAVTIANRRLPGRTYRADVMSRKFPSKKFGLITMLGLIEHVPNPDELIGRARQLLGKNGYLAIQTPNSGSVLAKILQKFWPPYAPVEHIHLFSRSALTRLLSSRGFRIVDYKAHVKPLPVYYVYQNFQNFGPHFYRFLKPVGGLIKRFDITLPMYIGEMLVVAQKE